MDWYVTATIVFGLMLFFLAVGMPIAFTLGILGLGGLCIFEGLLSGLSYLNMISFRNAANTIMTTIPLFVFMGEMLIVSGIGKNLFDMASKWLGRLPGGLAIGSVAATSIFGAMSGASTAAVATMGPLCVPEMIKRGYDKRLASGTVAAAGALDPIIPPSVILVVYAVATEQSIGKLFLACFIPGFALAFIMSALIIVWVWCKPHHAPPVAKTSFKEMLDSVPGTWPALILIFLVLATIYLGVATATEAAALGALGSFLIALFSKRLTGKILSAALFNTVTTTCMIMFIMICSSLFSLLLTTQRVTLGFSEIIATLELSRWVLFALIMLLYIFMGCFIDCVSIILITCPIVMPIIIKLGFDPIWFGAVLMVNFATAVITPPFALNLYVMNKVVPEVSLYDVTVGAMPFLIADVLGLIVVIVFPQIAMWLPSIIK
jgi:C4-dicarboxylate transporter, DctM subunit